MKKVVVIDGQGGRLGRLLIESILKDNLSCELYAIGTNSIATGSMLKAGAVHGATGENPVIVAARDADIIIYNSSIDEDIEDTRQLLDKCPLLEDFKAVREGNVWCSGKNMFQQPAGICDMIVEMNKVITGCKDDEGMQYLHRVEKVS